MRSRRRASLRVRRKGNEPSMLARERSWVGHPRRRTSLWIRRDGELTCASEGADWERSTKTVHSKKGNELCLLSRQRPCCWQGFLVHLWRPLSHCWTWVVSAESLSRWQKRTGLCTRLRGRAIALHRNELCRVPSQWLRVRRRQRSRILNCIPSNYRSQFISVLFSL